MAKSKREIVFHSLEELQKRLEEQVTFERYEFMERPEISQISKGRATAFQQAAIMLQLATQSLEQAWPAKPLDARSAK